MTHDTSDRIPQLFHVDRETLRALHDATFMANRNFDAWIVDAINEKLGRKPRDWFDVPEDAIG